MELTPEDTIRFNKEQPSLKEKKEITPTKDRGGGGQGIWRRVEGGWAEQLA